MKTRAFLMGCVVTLFWLAPNPNQTQARMPKRDGNKTIVLSPTTMPTYLSK